MFDDLDDPNPAVPGPAARAAVGARVRRIRQRRTAWVAGGTSLVLAVVAGTAVGLRDPGGDRVAQPLDATESPFETIDPSADPLLPSPEVTAEPTEDPSPTATEEPDQPADPTESGEPSPTGEPSGTASPTPFTHPGMVRDGKPGWGGHFTGCAVPTSLPEERDDRPFPFVSVTLDLPGTVEAGTTGEGTLTFRNDGAYVVRFDLRVDLATSGRNTATGQYAAEYSSDVIPMTRVELVPGASRSVRVDVETRMCGDVPEDDGPLPPGDYVMATEAHWRNAEAVQPVPDPSGTPETPETPSPAPSPASESGTWGSPRIAVRLT